MRKRLSPEEIDFLELEVKQNNKYSLNEEKLERLLEFRDSNPKKIDYRDPSQGFTDLAIESNLNPSSIPAAWIKTERASFYFRNPLYKSDHRNQFAEELMEYVSNHSPQYKKIKYKDTNDEPHLLIINPADIHLNKLALAFETGDDYNIEIAIIRVKEGVQGIIEKAKGFHTEKIIFVGGNDILHTDNARGTTTSGTPQDTDSLWYQGFIKAFQLYVEVIETLISLADVHFVYCPSNHDYTNGFFLCHAIEQFFKKNKNITFDCSMKHRKYFTYGENLIGFTHGDGGQQANLPLSMAHEAKDWSNCKHRYIYTHHIHHKTAKDYQSVAIESMRSASGTDSWHHRNQFCNNIKAIEGFIHHANHGQVARLNHIF